MKSNHKKRAFSAQMSSFWESVHFSALYTWLGLFLRELPSFFKHLDLLKERRGDLKAYIAELFVGRVDCRDLRRTSWILSEFLSGWKLSNLSLFLHAAVKKESMAWLWRVELTGCEIVYQTATISLNQTDTAKINDVCKSPWNLTSPLWVKV